VEHLKGDLTGMDNKTFVVKASLTIVKITFVVQPTDCKNFVS